MQPNQKEIIQRMIDRARNISLTNVVAVNEDIERLLKDENLLKVAQDYAKDLPSKGAFEHSIEGGKNSLVNFREWVIKPMLATAGPKLFPSSVIPAPIQTATSSIPPMPSPMPKLPISETPSEHILIAQYPQLFADIPNNIKLKLAKYIERDLKARSLSITDFSKYNQFRPNEPITQAWMREVQWLSLGNMLGYVSMPQGDFTVFNIARIFEKSDAELFQQFYGDTSRPFDPSKLSERLKADAQQLAKYYKIHLMPGEQVNPTKLLWLILNAYETDAELKNLLPVFKISPKPLENIVEGEKQILPQVVFYVKDGKEVAQKALIKIYNLFTQHPEIKGSGIRPRFNAKVTDLIWIAQGNGDYKAGRYSAYYEQPLKAYYRPDIAGTIQNYHLRHPETGQELIN